MLKHTPGPWNIGGAWKGGHGVYDIIKPHPSAPNSTVGYVIATVSYSWNQDDGTATEETIANARLIAAAPDLLAALEHMLGACDPTVDREDDEHFDYADAYIACDAARAAIAKARGE